MYVILLSQQLNYVYDETYIFKYKYVVRYIAILRSVIKMLYRHSLVASLFNNKQTYRNKLRSVFSTLSYNK